MDVNRHFQYYLALEEDLWYTARFVEVCEDNLATYSIEYTRLLLAACSEVDVVAKLLCETIDSTKSPDKINLYQPIIVRSVKGFCETKRYIAEMPGSEFQPWKGWTAAKSPPWWKQHNNVKHQRSVHFKQGNLENVLNAVAALDVLVELLAIYRGVTLTIMGRKGFYNIPV